LPRASSFPLRFHPIKSSLPMFLEGAKAFVQASENGFGRRRGIASSLCKLDNSTLPSNAFFIFRDQPVGSGEFVACL
jgi:hypothetical protein